MNSSCLYLEIGQNSLEALQGEHRWEAPLERDENGRLTGACRQQVTSGLQGFLRAHGGRPRQRAVCALSARGVSMRRLTVPPASKEERQRLLLLQIESEFPLPPEQLAWGYRAVGVGDLPRNGAPVREDLIVVAVKKEVIEEYSEILSQCGVHGEFTLAALSRGYACQQPPPSYAVLDIGQTNSELISFESGVPTAIRILNWGEASVTKSLEEKVGISAGEAERLKVDLDQGAAAGGESSSKVQLAMATAMDLLAATIKKSWKGQTLYLSGKGAQPKYVASALTERLGGLPCVRLETAPGQSRSTAISGLKAAMDQDLRPPILLLDVKPAKRNGETASKPAPWKWVVVAAILVLGLLLLPLLEAILKKPGLEQRLATLKAARQRLPAIDRELHFLQDLKQNQPPYLDALAVMAMAASPGTSIETISMNRKGDVSWRGKLPNAQQVVDFRSKLVDSGFFSNVTVEEQSPSPDRMIAVRMSARWKPSGERPELSLAALTNNLGKITGNQNPSFPPPGMMGGPPPQMSMPGPPPGMEMPPGMPSPARIRKP